MEKSEELGMAKSISPKLEDYLEAIFAIKQNREDVRLKDIAEFMHVSAPSALEVLANLETKGFLAHEYYGGIELTAKGRQTAQAVYEKHINLKKFLVSVLGVDARIADEDACRIEHCLSAQSIEKINGLMQYLEKCPLNKPVCMQHFLGGKKKCRNEQCVSQ